MKDVVSKKSQLDALNDSIKHWEDNLKRAKDFLQPLIGAEYCACCAITNQLCCDGCPIYELTGIDQCGDTPYLSVYEAIHPYDGEVIHDDIISSTKDMVDYLVEIRDRFMKIHAKTGTSPMETQG